MLRTMSPHRLVMATLQDNGALVDAVIDIGPPAQAAGLADGLTIPAPIFAVVAARMAGICSSRCLPGQLVAPISPCPPTTSAVATSPGSYREVPLSESETSGIVPFGSR